jgi:hypothetical protein
MIALSATPSFATDKDDNFSFDLVVSPPAGKACTSFAKKQPFSFAKKQPFSFAKKQPFSFAKKQPFGRATIAAFPPGRPVERLHVEGFNLPPKIILSWMHSTYNKNIQLKHITCYKKGLR